MSPTVIEDWNVCLWHSACPPITAQSQQCQSDQTLNFFRNFAASMTSVQHHLAVDGWYVASDMTHIHNNVGTVICTHKLAGIRGWNKTIYLCRSYFVLNAERYSRRWVKWSCYRLLSIINQYMNSWRCIWTLILHNMLGNKTITQTSVLPGLAPVNTAQK